GRGGPSEAGYNNAMGGGASDAGSRANNVMGGGASDAGYWANSARVGGARDAILPDGAASPWPGRGLDLASASPPSRGSPDVGRGKGAASSSPMGRGRGAASSSPNGRREDAASGSPFRGLPDVVGGGESAASWQQVVAFGESAASWLGEGSEQGSAKSNSKGGGSSTGEGLKGRRFRCMKCETELYASELLLSKEFGDQDWAGEIWGTCQGCAPEEHLRTAPRKAFKKESEKRWNQRKEALGFKVQTARSLRYNNLDEHMRKMFRGASSRVRRELVKQRIQTIAVNMAADVNKLTGAYRETANFLCKQYVSSLERMAEDPEYKCTTDSRKLIAGEVHCLTKG
ncbi:MAG: hypothetical protein GY772_25715, partial [bacterium]|nr:hypothetical protein [bacterium]